MKIKKLNQVGDTIIEVMIALVIMGSVLAGAYYLSNYSLNTILESHLRGDALFIAQSQLEQVKAEVSVNSSYIPNQQKTQLTSTISAQNATFCMNNFNLYWQINQKSICYFNASGLLTKSSSYPNFLVSISSLDPSWNQINVKVSWKQGGSNGQPILNQVDLYYGFNNQL